MAGVDRRRPAVHPVAGDEQRPVEAAAVVGHEPAVGRQVRRQRLEQRGLVAVVRQQELDLPERVPDPPAEPDEEGDGPGGRRQPGRLRVEADQRRVRRRLAGERRQPDPVERDRPGRDLAADHDAPRVAHDLAVDRRGQALGQDVAVDPGVGEGLALVEVQVARRVPRRGPVPVEPPGEPVVARRSPQGHPAAAVARGPEPAVAPEVAQQPERERPGIDARLEARTGAGGTPGIAVAAGDQARGHGRAARRGAPRGARTSPIPPGTASYR